MLYEAVLLFGILFAAGLLYSTLFQQRHALHLRAGLQGWLFVVLTAYFTWFWSHGGQTLAMKTWRIRVVDARGLPPRPGRALLRSLLAWLWFLPGLGLALAFGAKDWMLVLVPAADAVIWALAIYLDPQRQFLHDRLARTHLVRVEAPASGKGQRS